MADLTAASAQWANRPADERFWTVEEMRKATKRYAQESVEKEDYPLSAVRVEPQGKELHMMGRSNVPAKFTHWSFGQLCSTIKAPAYYLRALAPTLAAQNINYGIKALTDREQVKVNLYMRSNGEHSVRAFTSDKYTRIFNHNICDKLVELETHGWRLPPARPGGNTDPRTRPATEADCLKRSGGFWGTIKPGDLIAPAGAYASDHDMFCFMINENYTIEEPGNPDGLARGFFVRNSEVGAAALTLTTFLYRHVCSNHIVWDAKDIMTVRVRHVGEAASTKWIYQMRAAISKYSQRSAAEDQAKIVKARGFIIADKAEGVLDRLFKLDVGSRKMLEAAMVACAQNPSDGDPKSAWGMAQGITRLSQSSEYTDDRAQIDRAANKVLRMAWD